MRLRTLSGLVIVCLVVAAIAVFATQASAAVPHTVLPGETLWSIAAANNFTTDSLAAYKPSIYNV